MAYAAPATSPYPGGYPVQVTVTGRRDINRLWGIPFLGMFARGVLAIPHFVVLWLLGIGMTIWFLLGWIPILLTGRVPGIAVSLITEYIRRSQRMLGYVGLLLPGDYPPLEPGVPDPVGVEFALADLEINRLWGIPFIGFFVRMIVAIPHFIVLSILGMLVLLSLLILWIPILVNGRYPESVVGLYTGFLRYAARVQAWVGFLPVPYPPFSLS